MTDRKLLKFATSFRRGILGRRKSEFMCFAVCAPLVTLLNMEGVKATLREGYIKLELGRCNHFWIELNDGRVLDPTADQLTRRFGAEMPKVYLGQPTKFHTPNAVTA